MKKIIALALSLMMILSCVSALAEGSEKETLTMLGAFDIRYGKLPDGYSMVVNEDNDMLYAAEITSEDASKPVIELSINFNDEWYGVNTLADATEEDIAAIKQDFYDVAEMDEGDLTFEDATTGMGTPVLIAKAKDGSAAAIYTIYLSHEIELDLYRTENGDEITDELIQSVMDFLTDMEFVPLDK